MYKIIIKIFYWNNVNLAINKVKELDITPELFKARFNEFIKLVDKDTTQLNNNIFTLTESQARAILELRLHRLTSLERDDIQKDLEQLILEIKGYLEILQSRSILLEEIKQELIDIKPKEGSSYVRSLTEPFDLEMEFKQKRIENWFTRFGLITSSKKWHQVHVSGHGDGEQIKKVIDGVNAKKIIPIHTDPKNEVYHKKWHKNVTTVNQHEVVSV